MELPFVSETVNGFVSAFLSVVSTLLVLSICLGAVALVVIYTTHNTRLQRGLNPADKVVHVASFKKQIEYEVGIIAHSCGVLEPRQLRRFHCRVVQNNGRSMPLNEIYPDQVPATAG